MKSEESCHTESTEITEILGGRLKPLQVVTLSVKCKVEIKKKRKNDWNLKKMCIFAANYRLLRTT